MTEAIRKALFNVAREQVEKSQAGRLWTENIQQLTNNLSLGLFSAYRKLGKDDSLTDKECIAFFLDQPGQDFLFSNAPNSYWAWRLIEEAVMANETEKIIQRDFDSACKKLKVDFLMHYKGLPEKYLNGSLTTVETLLLAQGGFLLIDTSNNQAKAAANPLLK